LLLDLGIASHRDTDRVLWSVLICGATSSWSGSDTAALGYTNRDNHVVVEEVEGYFEGEPSKK
jgi:hypothetical protein